MTTTTSQLTAAIEDWVASQPAFIGPAGPQGPPGPAGTATGGAAISPPSRSWNAEYLVWQRGPSFTITGSGVYTSDRGVNGPGVGGTMTVAKETVAPAVRALFASKPAPRFAKHITWGVVPTSGEGRPGYPNSFSFEEMRDDDVTLTAGAQITVSAYVWCDQGQMPFYLYASQGLGVNGNSGRTSLGNTISAQGGGVDYSFGADEIYFRSAQMMAATTPQLFQFTCTLDDLSAATVDAGDNVLTIGLAADNGAIALGNGLHITLLKYDFGASAAQWAPRPDAQTFELAQYNYQRFGAGLLGMVTATDTIEVTMAFRSLYKNSGPAGLTLLDPNPVFVVGNAGTPGTNCQIVTTFAAPNGAGVAIKGFGPGLPIGALARYIGSGDLIAADYE